MHTSVLSLFQCIFVYTVSFGLASISFWIDSLAPMHDWLITCLFVVIDKRNSLYNREYLIFFPIFVCCIVNAELLSKKGHQPRHTIS